jgi:hypothetical protein
MSKRTIGAKYTFDLESGDTSLIYGEGVEEYERDNVQLIEGQKSYKVNQSVSQVTTSIGPPRDFEGFKSYYSNLNRSLPGEVDGWAPCLESLVTADSEITMPREFIDRVEEHRRKFGKDGSTHQAVKGVIMEDLYAVVCSGTADNPNEAFKAVLRNSDKLYRHLVTFLLFECMENTEFQLMSVDKNGDTILHIILGAKWVDEPIVKKMHRKAGIDDLMVQNKAGDTCIATAIKSDNAKLLHPEWWQDLLLESHDAEGNNMLHLVTLQKRHVLLGEIHSKFRDICNFECTNHQGRTPLLVFGQNAGGCSRETIAEMISMFERMEVDFSAEDSQEMTLIDIVVVSSEGSECGTESFKETYLNLRRIENRSAKYQNQLHNLNAALRSKNNDEPTADIICNMSKISVLTAMGVGETSRSSFKERASKCCWCVGSDPKDPKIEFVRDIVRRGLVKSTLATLDHFVFLGGKYLVTEVLEHRPLKRDEQDVSCFQTNHSISFLNEIINWDDSINREKVLNHTAVQLYLERKWRKLSWYYWGTFIQYILRFLLLTAALVIGARPELPALLDYSAPIDKARAVFEVLFTLIFIIKLSLDVTHLVTAGFCLNGQCRKVHLGTPRFVPASFADRHCRNIKIPQYLTYGFNIVDMIWMLLFIVYVVMRFTKYIDEIWIVAALLYFFHSLLALDYLSVVEFLNLGIYVRTVVRVSKEVLKFAVFFLVLNVIFFGTFHLALQSQKFGNATASEIHPPETKEIYHVFFTGLRILIEGQSVIENYYGEDNSYSLFIVLVYLCYLFIITIVMLNILIAQMSDEYSKVLQNVQGTIILHKALYVNRIEEYALSLFIVIYVSALHITL